ncbi:11286_t:CDS:2, partial [Acaulospora morrowiae]
DSQSLYKYGQCVNISSPETIIFPRQKGMSTKLYHEIQTLTSSSLPSFNITESTTASCRSKYVIGICAMDCKARSKPMRNILNRLHDYNEFETVIFGDKVILEEDVENWPVCDFFISFFSNGFPLDKAIEYVKLRRPFCVNDLPMQKTLWDRRIVMKLLDTLGIPTPKRLVASKDGGPKIDPDVTSQVHKNVGTRLKQTSCPPAKVEMIDFDTISVDGQLLRKPFVEKPISGEDHNIHIYFSSEMGGGGRRLFRKVSNKSSEFDPLMSKPRTDGSYIYEQFMNVDHAEDIKVYTIGHKYAHAETRKSPVVDGLVHRSNDGKEVRYVATLTPEEKKIASVISLAFGQTICGFDLVRVKGKSYVIDVNGWSFVKGSDDYYNNCARILGTMFLKAIQKRKVKIDSVPKKFPFENSWRLKVPMPIFRHAERTTKQKMKFIFRSNPFFELLDTSTEEIILRNEQELGRVSRAVEDAIKLRCEDLDKLQQLKLVLQMPNDLPGIKVLIKPSYSKVDESFIELRLIVEWGGEIKYDTLNNLQFLEIIFVNQNIDKNLSTIMELYQYAKIYSPQEYDVDNEEKLHIGLLTSNLLLGDIIKKFRDHTLQKIANILMIGDNEDLYFIHEKTSRGIIGDKEYSLRMAFDPGAHNQNIYLDARHYLNVAPR